LYKKTQVHKPSSVARFRERLSFI